MLFWAASAISSADNAVGLAILFVIIGMFAAPPILFLELRKRSRARKGTASNEVTGVTESAEAVVVPSSALFKLIGGIALVCEIFGAVVWSSAIAMRDSDVANGALVFLGLFGVVVLACYAANRNIRLFVQQDIVGCVGPLGGVRLCQLADLAEVRTVWHRYTGRGMGVWVFPTLHFRRRDTSDAIVTPAIFYRIDALQALAERVGMPIDLERPIGRAA